MWEVPKKCIVTVDDAMQLLDTLVPMKVAWEPFYAEGKRKPPFLQNIPDENLVSYFSAGTMLPGKALDLGCGQGRNALYLAKQGCQVEAIDLSATAIGTARHRGKEAGVEVHFSVGSVFEVLIGVGEYDIVYDSGLLHHLQPHRRPQYLEIVQRALKPTGLVGLVCFSEESAPASEDWEIYQAMKMPPGIGYSESRLCQVVSPYFEVLEFRPMKVVPAESGRFGMEGLWTLLMKARR